MAENNEKTRRHSGGTISTIELKLGHLASGLTCSTNNGALSPGNYLKSQINSVGKTWGLKDMAERARITHD